MAYRVVEGVPGSGKSYYIVNWLAKNFCVELKDGGWMLDYSKRVRVVTNVAGLQIPHEDFQTALDEAGGFETFFTKEYQRNFSRGWHIIYIFDEAQEWFHPKFCKLTKDNLLYFTWARHEGHDIFLLTQNLKLLIYDLSCLSEYIVQAQPRVNKVATELTYVYRTFEGTEIRVERIVFNKNIAALYRSAEQGEAVKIKNYRLRKYMFAFVIALLLMAYGFQNSYKYWNHFMHPDQNSSARVASAQVALPASSVSPSAAVSPSSSNPSKPSNVVDAGTKSTRSTEYYMYLVDYVSYGKKTLFLLGNSWLSRNEYPYKIVKKGKSYFALLPGSLVSSLRSSPRSLPLKSSDDIDFSESKWGVLREKEKNLPSSRRPASRPATTTKIKE